MTTPEEQSSVDWRAEVETYAQRSEAHEQRVRDALQQLDSQKVWGYQEKWETVYTLVRRREQMAQDAEQPQEPTT